jgi:recombination protein RecT
MNKPVLANNEKLSNLKNLLEKSKGSIAKTLPTHMSAERMVKIAVVAASRNPALLQCEPLSLLSALMEASQLGLEPFTGLQQAYIIPYKLRKGDKEFYEAQFMPSYRGLIDLARRSGNIVTIESHCVYEHDEFELELGSNRKLRHVPKLDGDRGKMKLVYAIAHLKDGGVQFEFLTLADIAKVKACSKAGSGPWNQWYDSMCRKSAIKRLCKYLPVSVDLARAISKDNALEGEFETDVFDVDSIDISQVNADEPVSATDELAKKLGSAENKL